MSAIYNTSEILAQGLMPYWVNDMQHNRLVTGTKLVGSWPFRRRVNVFGLDEIRTGAKPVEWAEFQTSFKHQSKPNPPWFSSYAGNASMLVYQNGGYGHSIRGYSITQNPDDIILGKPILSQFGNIATGTNGALLVTVIDNTNGSTPLTQTVTQSASQAIAYTASTTTGLSETTSWTIGGKLNLLKKDLGGLELNASLTNSATINTSTTNQTSNTETVSNSVSNQVTVQPGYKISVTTRYLKQELTVPFSAPVRISGTVSMTDQWGNTYNKSAGDVLRDAIRFGPSGLPITSGRPDGTWGENQHHGFFKATGTIRSQNIISFETIQQTLASPLTEIEINAIGEEPQLELDDSYTADIVTDGIAGESGIRYEGDLSRRGLVFRGTNQDDYIQMRGSNQIAYSHGGDDVVIGSQYGDTVYLGSPGLDGSSEVSTGDGDDTIVSTSGSHVIDAGGGNDFVRIALNSAGANAVTLGEGNDILEIDVAGGEDSGADFIIQDLTDDDIIRFSNTGSSKLKAEIIGGSVQIYKDGGFIGVLKGYADLFDDITGSELMELGLINLDRIKGKYRTIDDLKADLITRKALGQGIAESYSELAEDKGRLKGILREAQKNLFGRSDSDFTRTALSSRMEHDNLTSLLTNTADNWRDNTEVFLISDIFGVDA